MKIVKGLTAFILLPAFMFGGGFAVGTMAMDYFYPGRNFTTEDLIKQVRFDQLIDDEWLRADWSVPKRVVAEELKTEEPVDFSNDDEVVDEAALVSLLGSSSINADTVYIIQEYSRSTQELKEKIVPVPDNFIGMDFTVFSQIMADFDRYPTLSEMQKGMISCEVVSFSASRVVVRKTYEDFFEEIRPGYFLVNDNGLITVYLGDLKTVFMVTSIEFQNLPTALQQEILVTKYMEGEEELFGFLEAYSS